MSQLSGLPQVPCQKKGGNLGKWWWTNPTKDEPASRRCLMLVKIYPIEYPFCRRWRQKNTMLPGKPKRRTARAARGDLEMKRWKFNGGGVVSPPIGHTIEIHKDIETYWRNPHCYLGGSRWGCLLKYWAEDGQSTILQVIFLQSRFMGHDLNQSSPLKES